MEQKRLTKGQFSTVTRYLKSGIAIFVLTVLGAVNAHAFLIDTTKYIYYNSPYGEPTYQIVRKEMDKVYKNFPYDEIPVIAIAEIDLNGDRLPEMISYPMEQLEQEGDYCDIKTTLCPHYITEVRGNKAKNLGVIYSRYVSRGTDVKNGYWTLKVYNKGEKDPAYFDTYIYDKKKDAYVMAPKE